MKETAAELATKLSKIASQFTHIAYCELTKLEKSIADSLINSGILRKVDQNGRDICVITSNKGKPRLLTLTIKRCSECPYMRWEENNSCSNSAGNSYCKRRWVKSPQNDRLIEGNNKDPEIPDWCPLPLAEA